MWRNQKKMLEAKERADLLGRTSGEGAHILQIFDDEAQAMNSVKNSKRMLEDSFSSGVAILSKYAEQRDRLKVKTLTPKLLRENIFLNVLGFFLNISECAA